MSGLSMLKSLRGRSLLSLQDINARELHLLIRAAWRLKRKQQLKSARLQGQGVVLLFEKPSTRTRVAFQCALAEEQGQALVLPLAESHLGHRESLADSARTLSQLCRAVAYRGSDHRLLMEFATHLTIPLYNALSDQWHPTQALADLLTIWERYRRLEGIRVAFLGDGNSNVARSLALGCAMSGIQLTVAAPRSYWPDAALRRLCEMRAISSQAVPRYCEEPTEAVRQAQALYTDVWVSMGDEKEHAARQSALAPYQVDAQCMAQAAPDAIFLHCLPAQRGQEVSDVVLDAPYSYVWNQAANRKHTIKALLLATLS